MAARSRGLWQRWLRGPGAALLVCGVVLAGCDSVEERVADHHAAGLALIGKGEPGKALLEFRSAIKLDAAHVPSHFQMALILEQRGELTQAFAHLRAVVELAPERTDALVKAARYHLIAGQIETARQRIETALSRTPEDPDALAAAAAIALASGETSRAGRLVEAALAIAPDHHGARVTEIAVLRRSGRAGEALALSDALIAGRPDDEVLHRLRLVLLREAGDEAMVGAQIAAMIEAFPESLDYRRAQVLWAERSGAGGVAEAGLRALAARQPDAVAPVEALAGFVRRERGDAAGRVEIASRIEAATDPGRRAALVLLLAHYDIATGETAAAEAQLRRLAADGPPEAANDARVILARLAGARGDTDAVDQLVADVLETDPGHVAARRIEIGRLIERGDLETAVRSVRRAFEEAPGDPRIMLLEARAQERLGNIGLASDRLASAVRADGYSPETVAIYGDFLDRIGRPEAAEDVLTEAVARHPADAGLLERLTALRIALGDWAAAERGLSTLERMAPERGRRQRVALLIARDRLAEGRALIGGAGLAGPARGRAIAALVRAHLEAGEAEEAVDLLETLLAERDDDTVVLAILGDTEAALGRAGAAARFEAILRIDPAHAGAHAALSRMAAGRGDLAGAERWLVEGLRHRPENPMLMLSLAGIREAQGEVDAALALYDRLAERLPASLTIANNLASLIGEHRADDPEALAKAAAAARLLEGSEVLAHRDTLGWIRHLGGDHRAALEILAPVAEALPGNPWVRYHLGMVHAALDRPDEARGHLEAALAAAGDADFPPVDTVRAALDAL